MTSAEKLDKLKVGDYAILRGQRKGRYHLEGGVITSIDKLVVSVACDDKLWVMPLADLEPFTAEYKTPRGNEIVPLEGAAFVLK